ncbi:DUF1330 domain-containing protein [Tepidicaulis sp. LMO-SS28]|uniref:DUF1330 domain-containing protein n=1 Tax=Tepidicaulis sp. LMO-SS28 TaxID=3447455 RepID=UPI003EDF199B
MAIEPTKEQFTAFSQADQDQPIAMINLLKFREKADYPEGAAEAGGTGAEAYARYGAVAQKKIEEVGGRIVWGAPQQMVMIGDDEKDLYDSVAVVFYPSRAAFLRMIAMPDYQEAAKHRAAGLAFQKLLQCDGSAFAKK